MITDTYNIACVVIVQQALNGEISTGEAVKRLKEAINATHVERLKRDGYPKPKWMRKSGGD